MVSGFLVTMAQRVLEFRVEEMASSYVYRGAATGRQLTRGGPLASVSGWGKQFQAVKLLAKC
jgi:hypothetical protein